MDNETIRYKRQLAGIATAFLAIATLFVAVKTVSAIKGWGGENNANSPRPEIYVSGKGEVFAVPNIATFSFTVTEQGKTVKEAQDKATAKTETALTYLESVKIAEKDIKTAGYNIYPRYEYNQVVCMSLNCPPAGRQVLVGYEVSQSIQVKVRDTDQAGTILAGIGSKEVQNVSGLDFTIDDEDVVVAQAREKAIADAKAKAEILASKLGVKLVRITAFSESGSMPPIMYSRDAAMVGKGGAVTQEIAPSIPAGENKIVSTVTITYEIR